MKKYKVKVTDQEGKTHEFQSVSDYFHKDGNLILGLDSGEEVTFNKEQIQESEVVEMNEGSTQLNS